MRPVRKDHVRPERPKKPREPLAFIFRGAGFAIDLICEYRSRAEQPGPGESLRCTNARCHAVLATAHTGLAAGEIDDRYGVAITRQSGDRSAASGFRIVGMRADDHDMNAAEDG